MSSPMLGAFLVPPSPCQGAPDPSEEERQTIVDIDMSGITRYSLPSAAEANGKHPTNVSAQAEAAAAEGIA